jgi:hypothetical protein
MILIEKPKYSEESCPIATCSSQIPHEQASVVMGSLITIWVMKNCDITVQIMFVVKYVGYFKL